MAKKDQVDKPKRNQAPQSAFNGLLSGQQLSESNTDTDETPTPTPAPAAPPMRGRGHKSPNRRTMVGAGVTLAEKTELQQIATAEGVALNSILAFFIRDSMARYKAGKLKIPRKTINVIDMPK